MDAKTLCMAVLSHGDASGYEIRKAFETGSYGHIHDIGFSSIYPALARLKDEGHVSVTEHAQDGRPDKKVYRLTSTGRLALLEALNEPLEPERARSDFLFRMLFAHILGAGTLDGLIDERLREIDTAKRRAEAQAREGFESEGEAFVNGFALHMLDAAARYIDDHRYELVGASLIHERAVAE